MGYARWDEYHNEKRVLTARLACAVEAYHVVIGPNIHPRAFANLQKPATWLSSLPVGLLLATRHSRRHPGMSAVGH
jgi:hypothetical protein